MSEKAKGSGRQAAFVSEVQRRRERHEQSRREGDSSFWSSVGMMGSIGWTVVVPAALGVLLGRWLDHRLDSAHVFVVFCLLVGLALGCVSAWRLISEKL